MLPAARQCRPQTSKPTKQLAAFSWLGAFRLLPMHFHEGAHRWKKVFNGRASEGGCQEIGKGAAEELSPDRHNKNWSFTTCIICTYTTYFALLFFYPSWFQCNCTPLWWHIMLLNWQAYNPQAAQRQPPTSMAKWDSNSELRNQRVYTQSTSSSRRGDILYTASLL